MSKEEKKFYLYSIVLRYLVYKITENIRRIYLDVDFNEFKIYLTAYYLQAPSKLELELLDDIETNSQAHIPDFLVCTEVKLTNDHYKNEKHGFVVFAFYEEDN